MLSRIQSEKKRQDYLEKRTKCPEQFEIACARCSRLHLRCHRQLNRANREKKICAECSASREGCSFNRGQAFNARIGRLGAQCSDGILKLVSSIDTLAERLGDFNKNFGDYNKRFGDYNRELGDTLEIERTL